MGSLGIYTGPVIVALGLVFVVVVAAFQASRVSWQCENCRRVSNHNALAAVFAPKNRGKKVFVCRHCGKKGPHRAVTRQKWL